jgi:hypothetical protein
MLRGMKMFRGVLVFGGIATADVAAGQAKPQVYPGIVHFETLLATVRLRLHVMNLVEMCAFGHTLSVP